MASSDAYHCNKQTLLTEHELLLTSTQANTNTPLVDSSAELQRRKLFELNALQAIKICDLTLGGNHQNKLIYSTQISKIAVADSIYFIVEDEFGNACRVSVSCNVNSVPLVKGVRLAFLNPIFNMAIDGRCSLTVRNPTDMYLLQLQPITTSVSEQSFSKTVINPNEFCLNKPFPFKSIDAEAENTNVIATNTNLVEDTSEYSQTIPIKPYDDGTNLSQTGNKLFKEGRFLQAIIQYTRAIDANANDAVFHSNRALCYSKIGEFENALTDFQHANTLDPECFKYQYLVALTWSRIGNHKFCVDQLSKINPKDSVDSHFVEKLLKDEKLLVKNIEGEFDFGQMKQNFVKHTQNKIGDFIGPIQILTSPKHGRGMFTTRSVKKGENLCVVKATEFLDANLGNCGCHNCRKKMLTFVTVERSLHRKIVESAAKSKLTTVRIVSLLDFTSNTAVNINLYSGCGYEFAHNFDTTQYPLDDLHSMIAKRLVIDLYRFYPEAPFALLPRGINPCAYFFNGIWLLPSFINHSCIPNAVRIYIGDICIVRAIADIPEGEEVFTSYLPLSLFPNVQGRYNILGFQCDCQLCEFEKRNDIKEIVSEIMRLQVYLRSFLNTPPCIAAPMRQVKKEKISREDWCSVKSKLFKLAEQLKAHHTKNEELFPVCLQTTLLDLLMLTTCEADALELFPEVEAYFSRLEPETYVEFLSFWGGCLNENTDKVPPTIFQNVKKKYKETEDLFT